MDSRLPLLTVDTVIFPGLVLPVPVTDVQGRAVIRDLVENGGELVCGALAVRDGYELGERVFRSLYGTGCAATISEITLDQDDDGPVEITLTGNRRFKVAELDGSGDYLVGDVEWLDEELGDDPLGTATIAVARFREVRRGRQRDQPARPAHRRAARRPEHAVVPDVGRDDAAHPRPPETPRGHRHHVAPGPAGRPPRQRTRRDQGPPLSSPPPTSSTGRRCPRTDPGRSREEFGPIRHRAQDRRPHGCGRHWSTQCYRIESQSGMVLV